MQPHFLVYLYDNDRVIRYNFAQPKQILEVSRMLCAERTTPYEKLCNLFDQHTKNGEDMSQYDGLLNAAVKAIARSFKKRTLSNLLSGRHGVLSDRDKHVTSSDDFELVTWIVIR